MRIDVGKTLGFEAYGQERILQNSLVQKGSFIKAWGQAPWAGRVAPGHEECPLYTFKLGKG